MVNGEKRPGLPVVPGVSRLEHIGTGGFATVYSGHEDKLGRPVAIKILHLESLGSSAQKRFERECLATGQLTGHPHVVTVYDADALPDGRPYLKLELCRGSLADVLRTSGPLAVPAVVDIGRKIADALTAAHALGMVHRDVSPANILLRHDGQPALADFGLSVRTGPDSSRGLDALNIAHAAPEFLENGDCAAAGDIYSLGSTLYTLLTGGPPYASRPGEGPIAPLLRMRTDPVPSIKRADVPADLADLLVEMLARSPEHRPGAAAVRNRIGATGPTEPVTAARPTPVTRVPAEPPTGPRDAGPTGSTLQVEPVTVLREAAEPAEARRIPRRVLVGAGMLAAVLATGVVTAVLASEPAPPAAAPTGSASASPAPRIVLDPPADRGTSVDLSWSGGTDLDYAVIVATAGEANRTIFARRQHRLRVPVEAGRGYCFLVQASDGGKAVYESETRSVRGASCRIDTPSPDAAGPWGTARR